MIALEGKKVAEPGALSREIAMMKPGSKVELRSSATATSARVDVRIGELDDNRSPLEREEELGSGRGAPGGGRGEVVGNLGLSLDNLTDAARRQLGYKRDVKGALITGVESGSPADDAGLRPGDIIMQVDRHDVDSGRAARRAIAAADPPVLLLVRRGDSTIFLTLSPPRG